MSSYECQKGPSARENLGTTTVHVPIANFHIHSMLIYKGPKKVFGDRGSMENNNG